MIGYFLLIVLVVITWIVYAKANEEDNNTLAGLGLGIGLISTIFWLVTSLLLATSYSEAITFSNNRDYHQELVNSISDNMSPKTISRIISIAEDDNARIERHKKHCDNKMWGFLYNKGLAEVEPVAIPNYKISVKAEE